MSPTRVGAAPGIVRDEFLSSTPPITVVARPHHSSRRLAIAGVPGLTTLPGETAPVAEPVDPGDGTGTPAPTTGLLWPRV